MKHILKDYLVPINEYTKLSPGQQAYIEVIEKESAKFHTQTEYLHVLASILPSKLITPSKLLTEHVKDLAKHAFKNLISIKRFVDAIAQLEREGKL